LNAGGIIYEGFLEDTLAAFVMKTFPEFEVDKEVKAGSVVDLWLVPDSTFLIID
jgi:hypothetical protein